ASCISKIARFGDPLFVRFEPASLEEPVLQGSIKTLSIQPDIEWFLDITTGYDQVFASMHPKTRYNIRLASKKGVQVRMVDDRGELKGDDVLVFRALLTETAHAHGFRLHPESYYRSLIEFFLPQNKRFDADTPFVKLFFAEYNGTPIAATMIMFFGDTAYYIHGGSAHIHRDRMAPYLLHDRAITETIHLGYRYYNFGGVAPDGSLRHPLSGVTRFKKGFGGESLMYSGTYDYPLHKGAYMVYTMGRNLRRALSSFNG
ncbi:MAG: peptidoglycan bridge formation glycyltransferase FemA/FemB family protein, partial [Patescibacteria group bacterium]